MMKKSLLVICLLSIVALAGTGWGATWHVDASAESSGDGSSWSEAFQSIHEAVGAAEEFYEEDGNGEALEIWVKAGTYVLSDPIEVYVPVAIYAGFAGGETQLDQRDWLSNVTTVDGQMGGFPCFYVINNFSGETVLDGFTITQGNADARHPTTDGSLIGSGGGIHTANSLLTVANCTFLDNTARDQGGAIYNFHGNLTTTGCIFGRNEASQGGALYEFSGEDTHIVNSIFTGNTANDGGAIFINANELGFHIINCTVVHNSVVDGGSGGGIYSSNSSIVVTNSILWGNTAVNGDPAIHADSSDVSVTYCDVQDGYDGARNIDVDPLFVNPAGGDYHLRGDSPCIDAGTNSAVGLPVIDFEGDDRVLDGNGDSVAIVDMGVDEYSDSGGAVEEVIDVAPIADTFVDSGFRWWWIRWKPWRRWKRVPERLMNFGASGGLSVVRGRHAGHGFLDWRGTLIKFDLSDVPPGAEILQATLFLYHYNVWGEVISVHRMLQDWTEMGATFREPCEDCSPWWYGWYRGNYVQNATDTQRVTYHTRWASWDVTEDVELFVTAPDNYGWFLKSEVRHWSDWTSCSFYSKEAKQEHLRPFLRIRYRTGEAPSPAPPALM